MPFVLKHTPTSRLYTCMLTNNYKLAYYGTKYWEDEPAAAAERLDFLHSQHVDDVEAWDLLELSDNQLKLCNVKLKNDPRLILHWNEEKGTMAASISPSEL